MERDNMESSNVFQTIQTVPERCRVCYTCVRECPAKAIRIIDGQARVIHERCIGCGNCVRVCSQRAKIIKDTIPNVRRMLKGKAPVAAMLAPSFPAEFAKVESGRLVAMVKALGFARVNEVSFGADLVAAEYRKLVETTGKSYIATSCPAVIFYVEKYFPELVDELAPIVSPMVATARCLRHLYGPDLRVVFIGPCTAKKTESADEQLEGEVDEALTFVELRTMFEEAGLSPEAVKPVEFDEPRGGLGGLFPLSGGLLQAADMREDLVEENVVTATGRSFVDAVKEFACGDMSTRLLEILACDGACIMGAGMSVDTPLFSRRSQVSRYIREKISREDTAAHAKKLKQFAAVNLRRAFMTRDQRVKAPQADEISAILQRMGKNAHEDELNCGACGYETCREHAVAIHKGLAESEMCLPYTIDQLNSTIKKLASTQEALMQSERLASMGQLAAGIAHEVNNPLGIVLMYAHLLQEEAESNKSIASDAKIIAEQADRCKKIVSGLLHFARQNRVLREPADIREVIANCCRNIVTPGNIKLEVEHNLNDPVADIDADQIVQVLTNLISNAHAAMPNGGTLRIIATDTGENVVVTVSDTGTGIPPDLCAKIFEPFFTTKHIGSGTGLGLAVTYGIVKMHQGDIRVKSNSNPAEGPTGTTFEIELPRKMEEQT